MATATQATSAQNAVADVTGGTVAIEELSLLQRVADGDRAAFDQLFRTHHGAVYSVVVAVLRDPAQAQEVTQEVFLQVWQQAARFDPELGSTGAWVKRLGRRRAIDRVRTCESAGARDTCYAAADHSVDSDTVIEQVLHREEHGRVREALQRLSALQRQSIVLAYYAGMTTTEIAEQLGISRSTIKTRIRDGLGKLTADLNKAPARPIS